jgi:preprotein translocase subunit SecA
MEGRRYSDGLHQALEAKERVYRRSCHTDFCHHYTAKLLQMYHKLAV